MPKSKRKPTKRRKENKRILNNKHYGFANMIASKNRYA